MPRFDTEFQAWRRDQLNKLRNMDPDDLVGELDLDTDEILDKMWEKVEFYIEENYYEYDEEECEEGDEP
jgi:hypothetical protein